MGIERMETKLIKEIVRVNLANAKLTQQNLTYQAYGKPDEVLMSEWKGQEIAFTRMLNTLNGVE